MSRKLLLKLLFVVATPALVAMGCGDDDDGVAPEPDPAPTQATVSTDDEVAEIDDVTAAFVYVGPVGDAGWSWSHDQGRQQA